MTSDRIIGVNLLWLVPGDVGGTEEYTVRLLRGLGEVAPGALTLRIFVTPRVAEAYPWLSDLGELVVAPDPGASRLRRIGLESTWLRRKATDCLFVHHFGGTIPLGNRLPAVTTVHDLQPLDHPETFSTTKARWLRRQLPMVIAESTRVLTPSQWVADGIVERFGADPSRIRVVSSSHSLGPAATEADGSALDRHGLRRPYVLYSARTYPFKNHAVLLDAMARVDGDVDLVITGQPGTAHAQVLDSIDRLGLANRVHVLGRLRAGDFGQILTSAVALTFASTYEGFGLPVIEAMARGVPVIASDLPVLREVAGDAAVFVDPADAAAWAAAIARAVGGAPDDSLIAAGHRRAADFEPAVSAGRLVDVYRELLAGR